MLRFSSILVASSLLMLTAASADPLSSLQAFTLNDVKTAEAVYAANPTVPTFAAANQCLGYLDATLSQQGAAVTVGNLVAPAGVVSAVADLDVTLNTAVNGLSPAVLSFNQNCGGYIADLKVEVASHFFLFGLRLF